MRYKVEPCIPASVFQLSDASPEELLRNSKRHALEIDRIQHRAFSTTDGCLLKYLYSPCL